MKARTNQTSTRPAPSSSTTTKTMTETNNRIDWSLHMYTRSLQLQPRICVSAARSPYARRLCGCRAMPPSALSCLSGQRAQSKSKAKQREMNEMSTQVESNCKLHFLFDYNSLALSVVKQPHTLSYIHCCCCCTTIIIANIIIGTFLALFFICFYCNGFRFTAV